MKTIENQIIYNFDEMIKRYIDNALINLHVALPGKIEKFDPETQIAEIQPLIKRIVLDIDGNKEEKDLPKLINCPVMFPRAGGFTITFPVKKDDECLIGFSERALDSWLQSGGKQTPIDRRKHDLSDAIAMLGLYNQTNKVNEFNADDLVLRSDDNLTKITIKEDQIIVDANQKATINAVVADINISESATIDCPETTWTGNITHYGDLNRIGDVIHVGNSEQDGISTAVDHVSSGKSGATHTHIDSIGGTTSQPQ